MINLLIDSVTLECQYITIHIGQRVFGHYHWIADIYKTCFSYGLIPIVYNFRSLNVVDKRRNHSRELTRLGIGLDIDLTRMLTGTTP